MEIRNLTRKIHSERARAIFDRLIAAEDLKTLIASDDFGESEVLDYKRNVERCGNETRSVTQLTNDGKVHFANLLSAFSNGQGGVIVWGVEAKSGKSRNFMLIPNVQDFAENLSSALKDLVEPIVRNVEIIPRTIADNSGVAIVFIPQSPDAPHYSLKSDGYYFRVGESTKLLPHRFLELLFHNNVAASPRLHLHRNDGWRESNVKTGSLYRLAEPGSFGRKHGITVGKVTFDLRIDNVGLKPLREIAVAILDHELVESSLASAQPQFLDEGGRFSSKLYKPPANMQVLYPKMSVHLVQITVSFIPESDGGVDRSNKSITIRVGVYSDSSYDDYEVILDRNDLYVK